MGRHLLISLHLHGDVRGIARYHGMSQGSPEWPPSPARVFQALIAGIARGDGLPSTMTPALEWFERLPPPTIAAPHRWLGQSTNLFVPNNDADKVADPRDVSGIRVKKVVYPSLFAADQPLLYTWELSGAADHASTIAKAASSIYQLGRGVDMAWATGEVLDEQDFEARLDGYAGIFHRPSPQTRGERVLACPMVGSLTSLEARHRAEKLVVEGAGKASRTLFTNPPKARFLQVNYGRAHRYMVFELRDRDQDKAWPWAQSYAVRLVETLRDAAAARLRAGLPGNDDAIERTLIGRKPGDTAAIPATERVRIIPLPSIGFDMADRAIRRFVLDVPSGVALNAADLEWAFSGLEGSDPTTGELSPWVVTRTRDESMLRHYMGPGRYWRSITPVALPDGAKRRRIDPARRREEAKSAGERIAEEGRAIAAVRAALRHAEIRAKALRVRVQREPFEGKGDRAEAFSDRARFTKERLWHVAIEFDRPIDGPVVLGDGRFLGLGIMAPRLEVMHGVRAFQIEDGLAKVRQASDVTSALRRAVMARAQRELGPKEELPPFFSGHARDGAPARSDMDGHLAFAFDAETHRLFVIAPHVLERREPNQKEIGYLKTLDAALDGFGELLAGASGRLAIRATTVDVDDAMFGHSTTWTSVTPYVVTRHGKKLRADEALTADVQAECRRALLPSPRVEVSGVRGVSGVGLVGNVRLTFQVAVKGPLLLGRERFFGGGFFRGS